MAKASDGAVLQGSDGNKSVSWALVSSTDGIRKTAIRVNINLGSKAKNIVKRMNRVIWSA